MCYPYIAVVTTILFPFLCVAVTSRCACAQAAVDEPLLYESWGKKQTYILAFTKQEVVDVTENYTRQVTQQRFRHEKEKQYKILPQL